MTGVLIEDKNREVQREDHVKTEEGESHVQVKERGLKETILLTP